MFISNLKKNINVNLFNLTKNDRSLVCTSPAALKPQSIHNTSAMKVVPVVMVTMTTIISVTVTGPITGTCYGGTHANLSHYERNVTEHGDDDSEMNRDTLFVIDFVLAKDVLEREPVEIVDSYNIDDSRAWSFARIHNSEMMQNIHFEWYHDDELYFEMSTRIGISSDWRTYSSVTLQPGHWRVVLKDRHGQALDKIRFDVSK